MLSVPSKKSNFVLRRKPCAAQKVYGLQRGQLPQHGPLVRGAGSTIGKHGHVFQVGPRLQRTSGPALHSVRHPCSLQPVPRPLEKNTSCTLLKPQPWSTLTRKALDGTHVQGIEDCNSPSHFFLAAENPHPGVASCTHPEYIKKYLFAEGRLGFVPLSSFISCRYHLLFSSSSSHRFWWRIERGSSSPGREAIEVVPYPTKGNNFICPLPGRGYDTCPLARKGGDSICPLSGSGDDFRCPLHTLEQGVVLCVPFCFKGAA